MDFRIELVPIAVADVDRSVEFYGAGLGWNVEQRHGWLRQCDIAGHDQPDQEASVDQPTRDVVLAVVDLDRRAVRQLRQNVPLNWR